MSDRCDALRTTHHALRIALIHDWLNQIGGAENVLETLVRMYPRAPVFTSMKFVTDGTNATPILSSPFSIWRSPCPTMALVRST